MNRRGLFVTGTDTGIGKTWATLSLMKALQQQGLRVVGMKPVATGAELCNGRWVNEDALALQRAASVPVPYELVNPYVFEPPVSPHIAAAQAGRTIELQRIVEAFGELHEFADCVLVEGVGGWKVPLSRRESVADMALALALPVVLVVGLRLGCLNHALLSYSAIQTSGADFAGWIANHLVSDLPYVDENIRTLDDAMERRPLMELPHCEDSSQLPERVGPGCGVQAILRLLAP